MRSETQDFATELNIHRGGAARWTAEEENDCISMKKKQIA